MSNFSLQEDEQEDDDGNSSMYDSDAPSEFSDRSDLPQEVIDRMREKRKNRIVTWDSIPLSDKFALFNKWHLL